MAKFCEIFFFSLIFQNILVFIRLQIYYAITITDLMGLGALENLVLGRTVRDLGLPASAPNRGRPRTRFSRRLAP